ncbi:hypothetical protein CMEL01_07868 [Colletotrichum melonis]|uniref:Uncharacterized protein n=1 Tax=Colletotrichum melonis TaxID=1209925 RepID=A0AAI9U686_9PEZI|nr:hypothetical protein CMEL01_07868 [Colletotrichum melonis]
MLLLSPFLQQQRIPITSNTHPPTTTGDRPNRHSAGADRRCNVSCEVWRKQWPCLGLLQAVSGARVRDAHIQRAAGSGLAGLAASSFVSELADAHPGRCFQSAIHDRNIPMRYLLHKKAGGAKTRRMPNPVLPHPQILSAQLQHPASRHLSNWRVFRSQLQCSSSQLSLCFYLVIFAVRLFLFTLGYGYPRDYGYSFALHELIFVRLHNPRDHTPNPTRPFRRRPCRSSILHFQAL